MAKAIDEGKSVSVKIDVIYPTSGGTRPSELRVAANIDGKTKIYPPFKQ